MNIQKTKVFGTYNIVDVCNVASAPLNNTKSSVMKFKSLESDITEKYYDLLFQSGITYEKSKSESISERSIHHTGKDRVNFTYGEITLSSMIAIFDIIYKHRSDNVLHQSDSFSNDINRTTSDETTALDDDNDDSNQQSLIISSSQTHSSSNSNNNKNSIKKGSIFYDLGSGVGVPVFMAALLHPSFDECVGIEILNNLHVLALQLKQTWDKTLHSSFPSSSSSSSSISNLLPKITFYQGSFLDMSLRNWSNDGDIYFINSTCFDDALLTALEIIFIQHAKSGCYIITLSQPLKNKVEFEVVEEIRLDMSWGSADVFIHMRR